MEARTRLTGAPRAAAWRAPEKSIARALVAVAVRGARGPTALAASSTRRRARTAGAVLALLLSRALWALLRRHVLSELSPGPPRALADRRHPFLAFSGSGLLLSYYHGIATYLRDHFHLDNLRVSGISGGCTTVLGRSMGIDLYQVLLVGLHMKSEFLKNGISGVYFNDFEMVLDSVIDKLQAIGVTDDAAAELSARRCCFMGVTQCFPLPYHRCVAAPATVRDLAALILSSMSVVPFFRTPGVYQGRYCVDGGFSAAYSVPDGQPWSEVVKICPFPSYVSAACPPTMGVAEIQPRRLMLAEVLLLYPWSHYQKLIKLGYDDAARGHSLLVDSGLRPLRHAPVTPWSEWERIFAGIDENDLPPLSAQRATRGVSEREAAHDQLLRTHSQTDLRDVLRGPRVRRMSSRKLGSQSHGEVSGLVSIGS